MVTMLQEHNSNKIKVTIYNPSSRTGGTNNLLTNLSIILAEVPHVELVLIDYKNGKSAEILYNRKANFEHLIYEDKKSILVQEGFFISILLHVKLIENEIKLGENIKLILWCTHPHDPIKILPSFNIFMKLGNLNFQKLFVNSFHLNFYKRLKIFFELGISNYGIVFMDDDNFKAASEFYNYNKNKVIWPLTTSNSNIKKKWVDKGEKLTITFLGRLCDFKYYPIEAVLKQLKDTGLDFKLNFIGDGPFKEKLKCVLNELDFRNYHLLGHIDISYIDNILLETDICIAMATSALESSKLGIPTLVTNYSYKVINHYDFRIDWIFNLKDKEIADFRSKWSDFEYKDYIKLLRNDLSNYSRLQLIGKKCYDKWAQDFSNEALKKVVLKTLTLNNFEYKCVSHLLKKDLMSSIIDKSKAIIK